MAKSFVSVKSIVPKGPLKIDRRLEAASIRMALKDGADKVQEDFGLTVETWKTPVVFEKSFPDDETAVVQIASGKPAEIYGYVDQGTPRHIIRPVRAVALRFSTAFGPKTTPRVIGSSTGYRGSDSVFAKEVNHPGIQAREFTKNIVKKWKKEWPKLFRQHLKDRR